MLRSELVGCPPGIRTALLPEIPQWDGLCFDMMTFFCIKKKAPGEKVTNKCISFMFSQREEDQLNLHAFGYPEPDVCVTPTF